MFANVNSLIPKKIIKNGIAPVVIQKNIWFYWGGVEKPTIVDVCIEKIYKLNPKLNPK